MTRPGLGGACAVVGCVSLLAACNDILGIDPFVVYDGGAAGGPSTSASSTGGGDTGGSGGVGGSTTGSGGVGGSTTGSGGTGGAAPQPGQAAELDGENDFVSFPDTGAYTPTTGFTWELWFRGEALPTGEMVMRAQTLFGAMDGAGCEDIYLGFGSEQSPARELAFVVDGDGDCAARDPDPARYLPPAGFVDGQWYHVAAVADYGADETRLYLNGELVSEKQRTFQPIDRPLLIHAGHWADTSQEIAHFAGRIDELRVYGAPLSQVRIAEHHGAGTGTYGTAGEPDIVAGWHFDEGTGTQVTRYAGGADGTRQNGDAWGPGIVPLP